MAFTIKPQSKLGQLIDTAKAYLADGNPEKAKQTSLEILEMKPGSAAGLMVLGDAELASWAMQKPPNNRIKKLAIMQICIWSHCATCPACRTNRQPGRSPGAFGAARQTFSA